MPVPYGSRLHMQQSHTKKKRKKKSLTLSQKCLRVFCCCWEKSGTQKLQDRKSKKTRQKKTREQIGKGNQMTALRFQTGGWHQTSPASLWGGTKALKATTTQMVSANKSKHEIICLLRKKKWCCAPLPKHFKLTCNHKMLQYSTCSLWKIYVYITEYHPQWLRSTFILLKDRSQM